MQFLLQRGHTRLIPQGGLAEFPDAVLNTKRLDLYNLYKEVIAHLCYSLLSAICSHFFFILIWNKPIALKTERIMFSLTKTDMNQSTYAKI